MTAFVTLDEVAEINPRAPKGVDDDVPVSFLPMAAISEGGVVSYEEVRTFGEVKKGFTYFERGDFLIAKITPCFQNGKAALTCDLKNGIGFGSTEFHVVRADENRLDKTYLYYLLWNEQFRFYGAMEMRGAAGQKRVTTDFLKDYKIPLPPLEEQKRIAAILDKADAIRRKRQQAIELCDQFLRSVFLDMFGDPVTNPKGWEKGTIRELIIEAKYGTSGKADENAGEFPILRMGNITYEGDWNFEKMKYIDLDDSDKPKYLTQKGDLIFNRTNSKELVGKTAVFEKDSPMAIAGYLIRVRANNLANNYYISGYLNSNHGKTTLRNMCKSIVGMANINAQELQDIKILLPPKELQDKFGKIVIETKSKVKLFGRSESYLDDAFNSLIQKAFKGELTQSKAA